MIEVANVGALLAEIIVVGIVFMAVAKETVVVSFNLRQSKGVIYYNFVLQFIPDVPSWTSA